MWCFTLKSDESDASSSSSMSSSESLNSTCTVDKRMRLYVSAMCGYEIDYARRAATYQYCRQGAGVLMMVT